MSDLYYFWGQISPKSIAKPKPTTKKKRLILLSDLIKNSIYLIYEPVSYFYTAKCFIEGSYPALNRNLNI